MQTFHRIIYQDSRKFHPLEDESIDLVVTSPPYPMVKMWDDLFTGLNPDIGICLNQGDYRKAFELMHQVLDKVWVELYRVMKAGAIACINTGDATRSTKNRFQLFANHSRIQSKFMEIGFDVLPVILWRKQTNAPNKFMGSGMLPAGAYVTLEHEFILIFRKGNKRAFHLPEEKKRRRESGYFWEERNRWFSDLWDFKGTGQEISGQNLRKRSAAYPFLLPFRLINMYSVFGDTVLDPFLGTATTTLAAMACGRNSVGYEIEPGLAGYIKQRLDREIAQINNYNLQRLKNHVEFVRKHVQEKGSLKYLNSFLGFPVMTGQEQELKLSFVKSVEEVEENLFKATYLDDDYIKDLDIDEVTLEQLRVNGGVR
ncbi:MAG: DNA-methyltransferase [Dethiobacteria bacterium]